MAALAEASLSDVERRALDDFVARLAAEFGARLRSVWLYGSRARGEQPHDESDIDLLVVIDRLTRDDERRILDHRWAASDLQGVGSARLATTVYSPERLAQRREVGSFFIQEVDRDRIVLHGEQ